MDARPQRPARTLRVFDENAVHPAPGSKTIHQRNKSSPALSTMAQAGALRAAAKRTAFGDLSNTANTFRVSRDDTAMILKTVRGLKENLPPLQENRQTTFQKPAQRPTTGSKILMNSTGNSTHTTTKQPLNDAKSAVPQVTANKSNVARRLSVKKSTQIFKDPAAAPEVSQTQESRTLDDKVPEIPRPVAPVHRALPPLPTNHESRSGPDTQPGPTTNPVDLPKPLAEPLRISAVTLADGSEAFIADQVKVETRESSVPAVQNVEKKLEPSTANAAASMVDYEVRQVPLADHTNLQTAGYLEPARARKLPPVLEPEEYWEEDEQVENYEEEGYVTARSFKSRGDNTTGGATTVLFPKQTQNAKREVALAKQLIEGSKTEEELEDEAWDTTMVAEYSDDIFHYMRELEIKMLPNAHYMDNQAEIQWSMRAVLVDWIVQVHHRFNLLPETLFLTVNYIDRFLSAKVVSLGKLQLVGATAIFIAAKYEEIDCPSVHEIAFMVDGGYTTDEILKAERFMLTMLQFELGWPGPMSFLRRISKADDYDLETRTLAKYFLEITIMDERFVGSPPSFVAAGAHCLARMMLRKGNWSQAHVYYSEYTYTTLFPLILLMVECCENAQVHHAAIYDKYTDKRFKRASIFAELEMRKGFQPLPISHTLQISNPVMFTSPWDPQPGEIAGQA